MSDAKADEKKGLAGALSGLQLGGAKLKKTAVTADRSKPKLDGYLSKGSCCLLAASPMRAPVVQMR